MSPAGMTCRQMVELVTHYLEDRLPAADRERFERHLAVCDGCQAYVEQMRALVDELGRMPDVAIPAALESELLDAFRDWHGRRG